MRTVERRAWLMWGLGVLAYTVAVFHRASLGVSGLDAQQRFGTTAAVLSLFGVVQLGVYAAMQVPVGVLLDRVGSRRMIVAGALCMAAGQLLLATAGSVSLGLAARVLVGGGDAMTFISVLRLVPAWFPARRAPLVTQLTGLIGQAGQIAAAYPLIAGLHSAGWTPTFATAAGVGVLVAAIVAVGLRNAPPGVTMAGATGGAPGRRRVLAGAGHPPRALHPLLDPVLGQHVRAVLGLSVPGGVAGAHPRPRPAGCSPCWSWPAWGSDRRSERWPGAGRCAGR